MRIKITDIPAEGRELQFDLEPASLNARIAGGVRQKGNPAVDSQDYCFVGPVQSVLRLELEGSTVIIKGTVAGGYTSVCARCAEECQHALEVPVAMLLKPRQTRGPDAAHDEDVNFGYYDDREVDCGAVVEECLVLALPYTVLCTEECRGLCPVCGCNRNQQECRCGENQQGDERFAVLRQLKAIH